MEKWWRKMKEKQLIKKNMRKKKKTMEKLVFDNHIRRMKEKTINEELFEQV